jgi:hypothetical protein
MQPNKPVPMTIQSTSRVLFIHQGSLLDEGMISLIGSKTDVQVLKMHDAGGETLMRDIAASHPDVVMLTQKDNCNGGALYRLLTSMPALKKLRMIVFHANDNSVDIYSKKKMQALPSRDFLTCLQGASLGI